MVKKAPPKKISKKTLASKKVKKPVAKKRRRTKKPVKRAYKHAECTWNVYLLLCKDGSLYTGICKILERRLKEHNTSVKGAKYTRCRRPVKLVWHT